MDIDQILMNLTGSVSTLNANSKNLFKRISDIEEHLEKIETRLDVEAEKSNYNRGKLGFIYIGLGIIIAAVTSKVLNLFM